VIKTAGKVGLALGAMFVVANAQAINFFNVKIFGTSDLIGSVGEGNGFDSSYVKGANGKDIDFKFNKAQVGDNLPRDFGVINITFEAMADQAIVLDQVTITATALLLGSGNMRFTEIVEDVVNPGIIANLTVDLDASNNGGFSKDLVFSRQSNHIKVKKTIYLDAPNVQNQFDRAGVGLVEQKLKCVPEPISMVSMGIGVAALVARKRKGSR
jgi:hypothetical protein